MSVETILAIVGIVGAVVSATFTYLSNNKVAKTQDKKVDAEAFDRAQKLYASALDDFDAQLRRLRAENLELLQANQRLQKQISELETLVIKMRRQMLEVGLIPDVPINTPKE